jgi:hypothetical protein
MIVQLVEPAKFCSGYYNGTTLLGPQSFELSSTDYPSSLGYLCKHGQICIEDSGNNPHYGYVNFDNIFSAFLNVFTFVSLELWTDQMYQTQEGSSSVAALYYCLGVYIVAFILTFLLFGN